MNLILYDDPLFCKTLYPLTFTRPLGCLRLGILILAEKWERILGNKPSYLSLPYLSGLYPLNADSDNLVINSSVLPDDQFVNSLRKLQPGSVLENERMFLAARTDKEHLPACGNSFDRAGLKSVFYRQPVRLVSRPWDLFLENKNELLRDYMLVTSGRETKKMPDPYTRSYHERNIFIEEGVTIKAAIINAENGPVYIGKNVSIMEGSAICGPAAILKGSVISMGTKIRANTTIGPHCIVGGEVKNSIIYGYSNKAHEGYLGNSIVGEWCNLGANTNCSNLKNNFSNVKVWDHAKDAYLDSGQQFCGVFIGDHSTTSIGTMINTGTMIGVSANIFGSGLTPKFIPSFSWGGYPENQTYEIEKAIESAGKMMALKKKNISQEEAGVLRAIFDLTGKYRHWEK